LKTADSQHLVYQESQTLVDKEYSVDNNVVVKELPAEKSREGNVPESSPAGEINNNVINLQQLAEKACGVQMPVNLLENLVKEYGKEKVKEKLEMLGSVQTRNAPGFLITALKDDYQLRPGRPQLQQYSGTPILKQTKRKIPKTGWPDSDEEARRRKKEFIRSLYTG